MYHVVEEKTGYYASAAPVLELPRRGRWINVIFAAAPAGRQPTPLETVDDKLLPQRVAVEAMPDGGILKCKGYQKANRVILEVTDTGTGIPEDLQVFQLFKTTKPKAPAWDFQIVEQIVSEHRDTVEYISEAGKGTVFIVSLPL